MTIKEVAKLAGVSPAAVSRYLNGGPLSAQKQELIKEVIKTTGYKPDPMAQTLRTGKSGQIGVIVPKIYSDSVSQITEGINEKLSEFNYLTILGCTNEKPEQETVYLDIMQNSQVEGIILMGSNMSPRLRKALEKCSKPVVITGQNFQGFPCVYHDDYNAVRELTQMVIDKGRKHIAYIGVTNEDPAAGKNRRDGFISAFSKAGFDLDKDLVEATGDFSAENAEELTTAMLKAHPEIDGIVCATDRMALGTMRSVLHSGRTIPGDISIVGVGDSWVNSVTKPSLTTAHLYYRQAGEIAADMLIKMIKDSAKQMPPRQTMLEYSIISRETV